MSGGDKQTKAVFGFNLFLFMVLLGALALSFKSNCSQNILPVTCDYQAMRFECIGSATVLIVVQLLSRRIKTHYDKISESLRTKTNALVFAVSASLLLLGLMNSVGFFK